MKKKHKTRSAPKKPDQNRKQAPTPQVRQVRARRVDSLTTNKPTQPRPTSPMVENTTLIGRFQGTGRGTGFFFPQESTDREVYYFIPAGHTNGAWDGDTVEVELNGADPRRPGQQLATVIRVLERVNHTVTGVLQKVDGDLWLKPDTPRLSKAIRIIAPPASAKSGLRAAVAVTSYGQGKHIRPTGTLQTLFGPVDDRNAAVESVLFRQDIHRAFPEEVLVQAQAIPQTVPDELLQGRTDLRGETIITIDGSTSKDLDDAVSLTRDGQGRWVLGVHIADVSSYVPAGSPLDEEAYQRGTSVYFADQVIPMLPVELSNGICSLNPGVDRLTLTCFMTFDDKVQVVDYAIFPSVIRSAQRMTYEDCNRLLAGGDPLLEERYAAILPLLRDMAELSAQLEQDRRSRGGLDLESQESYICCDPSGQAVDILPRTPGVSEGIIESFMLAANETVARHLGRMEFPAVYRVHEKPSAEKGETLRAMLSPFHISLQNVDNFSLQKVLDAVRGREEQMAVNMMVLRSLMKARYDVEDLGHFGLAAPHYCHFTSPIRRYPDLMVHRSLHALWAGEKKTATLEKTYAQAALQSSQREVAAQTAQREITKLYFAEYMARHLGETFPVVVTGMNTYGLYVSLAVGVEGLIPTETLPVDEYLFDGSTFTFTGLHTGAVYTLGLPMEAVCVYADPTTGQIEFRLPGQEHIPHAPKQDPRPTPEKKQQGRKKKQRFRAGMHVPRRGKGGK